MLHRSVEASLANEVRGVVTLVVPGWELHIDAQSHIVAARRHFPQNIVSVRRRLAQLEIRWPDFVRQSAWRECDAETSIRISHKVGTPRCGVRSAQRADPTIWSGCVSFRVCEFLVSFRRIDFFDHYLVVLEQALEKLLVQFQSALVGPVAANHVANFS